MLHEDLNKFLEVHVFPTFTHLFIQAQETSSPIVAQTLDVWMKEMLEKMRSAITKHVHGVLEETRAAGTSITK